MKRTLQIILLAVLAGIGYLAFRWLFPDDATVIRKQLTEMAAEASFAGDESPLAKVSKAGKLAGYFTVDARIEVRPWGARQVLLNGRAEIREVTIGARSSVSSLDLAVDRMDVTVADDRATASVIMAVIVRSSRQTEPWYQDLEVEMQRIDGDWLISHVRNRELIRQ